MRRNRIAMLRLARSILALVIVSATLRAQTPDLSNQRPVSQQATDSQSIAPQGAAQQTVAQLMQQIKELQERDRVLEERVRALEAGQKSTATPDASASSPSPSPTTTSAQAAIPAPPAEPQVAPPPPPQPEMHSLRGIQWRGFGEADYKVLNQRTPELATYGFVPGSSGNFYTGDFDLFLNSRLTEKSSVLAEIDFEEQDAQSYHVDLRRMLLNLDANEHLRMSFGRYQTYIGYYNWAFRSAAWMQTTADRPLVEEYASDGGLLPTQAVGVYFTGTIPSGKLGLNYVAEYGSADTIRPDINNDGLLNDENNGNHVVLGFFAKPDYLPGLRIGGSVYRDQISDLVDSAATGQFIGTQASNSNVPSPEARWNQTIVNGHIVYVAHGVEFLNEGFLIRHSPIGPGVTYNTPAFYTQFSKRLGPIRPFFRYQYVNASPENFIYNDVGLRYGPSFGARYDINSYIAFKAQLGHIVRSGQPDLDGLHLQLSGTF